MNNSFRFRAPDEFAKLTSKRKIFRDFPRGSQVSTLSCANKLNEKMEEKMIVGVIFLVHIS